MDNENIQILEEKLKKANKLLKGMLSIKDMTIKDSDLIKFNSHGQWTIAKIDQPEK